MKQLEYIWWTHWILQKARWRFVEDKSLLHSEPTLIEIYNLTLLRILWVGIEYEEDFNVNQET
jgi:hypothetical protein